MNKLGKAFLTAFIMMATLTITSMLMVGCKSTTEPDENYTYDSEAAADITAASLGTESGGAGVSFSDASDLMNTGSISGIITNGKSGTPKSIDSSYDAASGLHTITVKRLVDWAPYYYEDTIVYKYTFFDKSGQFSQYYQKGVTDKITILVTKKQSLEKGERLDADVQSSGNWVINNITTSTPTLGGTFNRSGAVTFKSPSNKDRHFSFDLVINLANDTIVKSTDGNRTYTYLKGAATSDFSASTDKYDFKRHTDITLNGDGTANLLITRTSGDGQTETHEVDVKIGKWKRRIR